LLGLQEVAIESIAINIGVDFVSLDANWHVSAAVISVGYHA